VLSCEHRYPTGALSVSSIALVRWSIVVMFCRRNIAHASMTEVYRLALEKVVWRLESLQVVPLDVLT